MVNSGSSAINSNFNFRIAEIVSMIQHPRPDACSNKNVVKSPFHQPLG